jgi:hypothetical protein
MTRNVNVGHTICIEYYLYTSPPPHTRWIRFDKSSASWTRHSLLSTWTRNVEERNFFSFSFLFILYSVAGQGISLSSTVYKLQQCPVSGKSWRKLSSTSAFKDEQTKRENGSKGAANGQKKKKNCS